MEDEISADAVQELLEAETDAPRLVDVRSPMEFSRGHIPGSENIPLGEIPGAVEELADEDHVVTVCASGNRSLQAVRFIAAQVDGDANVESMRGGVAAWSGDFERAEAAARGGMNRFF